MWATEFISENTLTRVMAELRTALGDDARNPRSSRPSTGEGYRLMVPVERCRAAVGARSRSSPPGALDRDDDRNPYPGLAAFTEADAEFFFGREAEVAHCGAKSPPSLLAVIGPSGVGKSSFLRAGLIPAAPEGWGILICQPGEAPFAALARALVQSSRANAEAIAKLLDIGTRRRVAIVVRWRDAMSRPF